MDTDKLRQLAESSQRRAEAHHALYMEGKTPSILNDYFYWIGHANAYKGVIAMIELATVVDEEADATPQCP